MTAKKIEYFTTYKPMTKVINGMKVQTLEAVKTPINTNKAQKTKVKTPESLYKLKPLHINVIHSNGSKGRINVYSMAYAICCGAFKDSTKKRAIELYEHRADYCSADWEDMLCTVADSVLFGCTDGNKKYHIGYYSDNIADYSKLTATAYSALNSYLYDERVTGANIGRVELYQPVNDENDESHYLPIERIESNMLLLFNIENVSTVNKVKFHAFVNDVIKHLNTSQLIVFNCLLEHTELCNLNGTILTSVMADYTSMSDRTVRRHIKAIKVTAMEVVSNYLMDTKEFIDFLQA